MADASFQQEFLDTHNAYRLKHISTPLMTLSEELCASAQIWANHLLETNSQEYSDTQDGENMFFISSTEPIKLTGKEAVDEWYREVKNYDWSNPMFQNNSAHFTQVVWKDSTELGAGMATDGRRVFVVGQYRQKGNIISQFKNNILPLNTSFQQEFLETHNAYRSRHNAPPMILTKELSASAQKWADHLLKINGLQHSDTNDGESIYFTSGAAIHNQTGKEAVDSWYSEIKDYNWSSPTLSSITGDFTQVVWKDSTELGVGVAKDDRTIFVVGHYRPIGNIFGQFEKNVLPLDASFQQEFLDTHNAYRLKHVSTPLMTLSEELCASAQIWANHLLETNSQEYSDTQDGENMFFMSSTEPIKLTGKEAVDEWYREVKNYDWSNPMFQNNSAHFTQVVWKDSTELGAGMATDGRRVFVVGQYRQKGNIISQFKNNILPLNTSFQQEFLETHNAYRSKHNAPPMILTKELSASAQKWADHLLKINGLQHSDTNDGESIYFTSGAAIHNQTGKEAVDSWYSEIKDYNWSSPTLSSITGDFTQVVWKDSTELGVGVAKDDRTIFVVGHYRPIGNIFGQFEKNVLPLAEVE